jgi:hypothetical protein
MKKLLIMTAILVLSATSCFALDSDASGTMSLTDDVGLTLYASDADTAASISTASIGKFSTGVGVGWKTDAVGYALVTQHKSGTKGYGSSYDSTAIYQFKGEKAPGVPALTTPASSDTASFVGGTWKPM